MSRGGVRGLCLAVLLAACAGALLSAAAFAADEGAATVQAPAAFEPEIAAFEAQQREHPVAPGGVVFLGSSSLRLWPDLAADFPGLPVINRGFGGSTFPDLIRAAPRIVLPLAPRTVVIYAGDNDINNGRLPAQVRSDYRALVKLLRRNLPRLRIVLVSVKPSPSRWALAARMREANGLLAREVARDRGSRFVDVFTPMLDLTGQPRGELYGPDALHMSPAGYALWRERIAAALQWQQEHSR